MSDSESMPPNRSTESSPLVSDDESMSGTKHQTIIEDTKSRSGSQPESKEEAAQIKPDVVAVGTRLGPYELVRKLGQGGMGAVYEARHHKLGKTFALKVLPGGFASNRAALTRFEREMQAIGKLDHPHIIKATDADEWQGTHYLVMEYVEGTDLSELVKARGPLSVRDACKAIRQAAMGLEHAHQHGLVHRDIKPSNLFVTKSGQIKLLDLGLARLGDDGEHQRGLTTIGQILGTPDYMAPEQWDDTHSVDARADLYSLGCTLFFVLTGRAPYADVTKSSLLQLMKAHVEGAIPNLTDIRLDVPAELNAVFVRLLAKNADDRYATAGEVIAALEPFTRKGSDTEVFSGKPVFVPGKEPPVVRAVESTSKGSKVREGDLSSQRSIKSLSASSTDDAFGSNRPMIQSDRSASMVETIIQSRPQQPSRGRGPLLIGISLVSMAVLIGLAIQFTSKPATDSASRETSTAVQSTTDNKEENQTPTGWHGWPADAPKPAIAPFDADQAKKHQEEWAAYLKVPVEYTNSIGMKFRLIPPGEFLMGSTPEQIKLCQSHPDPLVASRGKINIPSEGPQHRVVLTRPLYCSTTEVTQDAYETIIGLNPSYHAATGAGATKMAGRDTARYPVESVAHSDAVGFCQKLTEHENVVPKDGQQIYGIYQLPTEAEWEYICRAGSTTLYYFGDDPTPLPEFAWYSKNSDFLTHVVGQKHPNPFGIFDLYGNCFEWCLDVFSEKYYGDSWAKVLVNPSGPIEESPYGHVIRGARIYNSEAFTRSAFRDYWPSQHETIGFRVVLPVGDVGNVISASTVRPKKLDAVWSSDAPKPAIAPFDADQAKKHQEEWAAYLKVPVEWENSIGMKFRLIPPGEFDMGSTPEEINEVLTVRPGNKNWLSAVSSEGPRHRVKLERPFYLSIYETRQVDFEKLMKKSPSHFSPTGEGRAVINGLPTDQHPVEQVSWIDSTRFCQRLSEREKLTCIYYPIGTGRMAARESLSEGNGYRLPTEAEWEFAYRAGASDKYSVGNEEEDAKRVAWFRDNSEGRTHAVGELSTNAFGIYDMAGNVSEWCHDGFKYNSYGDLQNQVSTDPFVVPSDDTSPLRKTRGGSWLMELAWCRAAFRSNINAPDASKNYGFRVVTSIECVKQSLLTASTNTKSSTAQITTDLYRWPSDAPKPAIAPFDADQAKKHQEEWAAYLKVPVEHTNTIGMKFRLIPPGEFTMGSTAAEIEEALKFISPDNHWQECVKSEAPQHKVILTQPTYLGVHEVTQAAYQKVMGKNPSHFAAMGQGKDQVAGMDTSNHPVDTVSWNDAVEFCAKLSQQEKLQSYHFRAGETITPLDGAGYRLPTEAEWEFACRAGMTTKYWISDKDEDLARIGWFSANSGWRKTHAVGELKANPFGIYDIHGNVWEWVQDLWEPTYYGQFQKDPAINPTGGSTVGSTGGSVRVIRGGSFRYTAPYCRASNRFAWAPSALANCNGFRVSLVVDAVKAAIAEKSGKGATTGTTP